MNPKKMMQLHTAWKQFSETHPRVGPFLKAVQTSGISVGTVIEVTVETPDGKKYTSNIKVQPSDLELLQRMRE